MTPNERIVKTCWQIIRGEVSIAYMNDPGMCLAVVRQVIEKAMGWPGHTLYDQYVIEWVQPPGYDKGNGHWARDFERAAKRMSWAVAADERRPGDILFNWRAAWSNTWGVYIGHVGILLEDGMVFENIDPAYRPHSFQRGALALTPEEHWPTTLVARLPQTLMDQ